MKQLLLTLMAVSSLGLAACNSGGGSNGSTAPATETAEDFSQSPEKYYELLSADCKEIDNKTVNCSNDNLRYNAYQFILYSKISSQLLADIKTAESNAKAVGIEFSEIKVGTGTEAGDNFQEISFKLKTTATGSFELPISFANGLSSSVTVNIVEKK